MSLQPTKQYFQFPTPAPVPAPTASPPTTFTLTATPSPSPVPLVESPAPAPQGKQDLSDRNYVTKDAYCLYTTQGQIICNKKAEKLPVAPWGHEQ